jgi:hypothetical protein
VSRKITTNLRKKTAGVECSIQKTLLRMTGQQKITDGFKFWTRRNRATLTSGMKMATMKQNSCPTSRRDNKKLNAIHNQVLLPANLKLQKLLIT